MIYLDNNATTMIDESVLQAMIDAAANFGNPSSTHSFGRRARHALVEARAEVSSYLNVNSDEIIFNSGATEGLNTLIKGIASKNPDGHIITSDLEHPAVYLTVKELEQKGSDVTFLSPKEKGAPTPDDIAAAIRDNTSLIVLMAANNETGVKTDIEGIAAVSKGIPFVVDGVASFLKEEIVVPDGVSAICFSGHKFHAPKGVGFSFVRSGLKYEPLLIGGGQEYQHRAGTENLLGIIGMAKAISLSSASEHMRLLRDRFEERILELPGTEINGQGKRVVNTSNVYFKDVDGEMLLMNLDREGIAAGYGSACSSGTLKPSRVLLNMGYSEDRASSSIRFSFSRFNTEEEIDKSIQVIRNLISVA